MAPRGQTYGHGFVVAADQPRIRSRRQSEFPYFLAHADTCRNRWRTVARPPTYANLLEFAGAVRRDTRDLRPRDMIDLQSFNWVQSSDVYP